MKIWFKNFGTWLWIYMFSYVQLKITVQLHPEDELVHLQLPMSQYSHFFCHPFWKISMPIETDNWHHTLVHIHTAPLKPLNEPLWAPAVNHLNSWGVFSMSEKGENVKYDVTSEWYGCSVRWKGKNLHFPLYSTKIFIFNLPGTLLDFQWLYEGQSNFKLKILLLNSFVRSLHLLLVFR